MQQHCKFTIFADLKMSTKINWDVIGILTSIACAIHCAILPLMIGSLPLFGINIIHNVVFEWGMIAAAFCVGSYSLFHGYVKHHHLLLPIYFFCAGFLFLFLKQFFHAIENWFLLPAVSLIVVAHWYNFRLCHQSKCNSPHHKH